jgi:hypothetical protein
MTALGIDLNGIDVALSMGIWKSEPQVLNSRSASRYASKPLSNIPVQICGTRLVATGLHLPFGQIDRDLRKAPAGARQ